MKGLLLDTHVFIWWLTDNQRLSPECRGLLEAAENAVLVSAASVWEMAIKSALGKLRFAEEVESELADLIERSGFTELPVTAAHAAATRALPLHHADPFDRMLIAQAISERLTLATADRAFASYQVPTLRASR